MSAELDQRNSQLNAETTVETVGTAILISD